MAIDWGSWQYASGNGMRVGIDVSWGSSAYSVTSITATVLIYTQNQYAYSDAQTLTYGGSISGTTNYTNSTGPTSGTTPDTARLRATKTYTWTYAAGSYITSPSTRTFSAAVSGAFNGVTPSKSVNSAVPGRQGTTPDAPSVSSSPGNNSVSISYSAPGFDGYSTITSYEYSEDNSYYAVTGDNPILLAGTNGTEKTVWVRAVNAYGSGPAGSAASTPRTTPGAPTSMSSTPSNGSISVSFAAPSSNGGNAISAYEYSTDDTNWSTLYANPFTLSGSNGTSITAYVRAVNAAGAGPSASTSSTPRTTPGAPSVSSTPTNGSVSISYSAPASDGGNAISSYQYSTDNATWTTTPSNPFSINGANGTPITIYVRAVNAAGGGTSTNATSTPRTIPGAPGVTSTPGNVSVSVGYTAPASNGGASISSYQYSTDDTNWTNTPSNPFPITGLTNGNSFTIYVRAVNAAGSGASASATSTPRTTPSIPLSFAGNNSTFGQISLSWQAPDSNGGSAVTSYILKTGTTTLQNANLTTYVHTGLSPYTDYSYTVAAVNAAGESSVHSLTVKSLGGIAKVWDGTSWVTVLPKVWDGAAWTDAQARMWDGAEWKHGI